jgi:transposase-like protein
MLDLRKRSIIGALRKVLLRLHYRLSLRHIEEMMRVSGFSVAHATVHRWANKMLPVLTAKRSIAAARRFLERAIKRITRATFRPGSTIGLDQQKSPPLRGLR